MFQTKPSSRRSSHSKKGSDGDRISKRRAISSTDMRLTFENVLHQVSKYQEDMVDKESVVKCLKSIYDWIVFDSDMQLDLPVPIGSVQMKMWPHGAKVDTRRKPDAIVDEKSSKKLKEVDEKSMINIASSVVSSNLDDQKSVKSKGEVMVAASKGVLYGRQSQASQYPSSVGSVQPGGHVRMVPEAYQQGYQGQFRQQDEENDRPPQLFRHSTAPLDRHTGYSDGYGGPPAMAPQQQPYRPDMYQRQPAQPSSRIVPRYSVMGGTMPPVVVEETPEMVHAQVFNGKKTRKTRVGTTRRAREDDDGVPVTFADE